MVNDSDAGMDGARAAGMLHGIIDGWKRNANPGALDDLVVSFDCQPGAASATLLFGGLPGHEDSAGAFVLMCVCAPAPDEVTA